MRIWTKFKEGMKQASENSKRASESAKGLKDVKIPDDDKRVYEKIWNVKWIP